MRAAKESTALVVRPRSSWRRYLMVSLAAFGLTIAAVYFISRKSFQKTSVINGSKAVAIVEQKAVKDRDDLWKRSVWGSSFTLKKIKTRIMSPAFMRQAFHDAGLPMPQAVENSTYRASSISPEELRQGLSIQVKPDAVPGGKQIILELTLIQSPDASGIVHALADRFVREYRTFWAAEMREAYRAAVAQADQARQAHRGALENLQTFKDGISKQAQLIPQRQQTQIQTARQTASQTADNPAWVELTSILASLRRQEAEMLVNKTALHPDIQRIRGRIADFELQLASTPRFAAESSTELSTQEAVPTIRDKTSPLNNAKDRQKEQGWENIAAGVDQNDQTETLKQLQDAAERSEQEYLIKFHREQQMFQASHRKPIFSVSVNPLALAKTEPKSNRGLIELVLLSGFVMAVGTSVFSSGVATEPVLATIADLELLLPVPIIGVVPGKDPTFDPATRRQWRAIRRWSMILLGALIVLGCGTGLFWFFSHLGI